MSGFTSSGPRSKQQSPAQVLRVLWLAHLGSVAVFAVVAVVLGDVGVGDPDTADLVRPFLALAGVVAGLVSLWWRRSLAVSPGSPLFLFVDEQTATPGHSRPTATRVGRLMTNCVIVWALSEGVAVFGLVLALLSGEPTQSAPFMVAAAVLLYLHRPAAWPVDRVLGGPGAAS